jgi:hypothetical protein
MTLIVGVKDKDYFLMPALGGKSYPVVAEELGRKQIAHRVVQRAGFGRATDTIIETSLPPGSLFSSDEAFEIKVNTGG